MKIILLGPPGAGKGTQAKQIADKFKIPHISTGDIFRKNIKEKTVLGIKAKDYIDKGKLVPDDLTVAIVKDRINRDDCKSGFLLDGFPRTVNQADSLNEVLKNMNSRINYVINIDVPRKSLIQRLTGRRVCKSCGASYHIKFNSPKKEGICDVCGGNLVQRDDDDLNTVINRLEVYDRQTAPLIDYYKKSDLLCTVDGDKDVDLVFKDICNTLEKCGR